TTSGLESYCSVPNIRCSTCSTGWLAQSCLGAPYDGPVDDALCWPSMAHKPRDFPFAGMGFYSPGLICPTGYTSACTSASIAEGESPIGLVGVQFPLIASETAIGCCPTGFTCTENLFGWQTCHMAAIDTIVDIIKCDATDTYLFNSVQIPFTADGNTVMSMAFWAPMIQINWQASDRNLKGSTDATLSLSFVRGTSQTSTSGSPFPAETRATNTATASPTSTQSSDTNV
ncbi:hypothetical protein P154DRAFT_410008, partial [Amniculicola lignicola CBS 123094]